ncbi:hypothetical protein [Streptomyces griseorubiginosus]|uniref:hypothetical protein n=1 Tax=Streptomyces griseorubiginosus TaxID=67304 RepID=UPI001AD6E6F5|nr:hypothetical protein [Streptomyces griseorubiginosus]MBO4258373.1 hypothetical protein [Streptomyces griseorubiginosus]
MTAGVQFATGWDVVVLVGVLLVLTVALATVLIQAWPTTAVPGGGAAKAERVRILLWTPLLQRDTLLFLVVTAAGGLGALIHVLRSVYEYVGDRRLRRSWLPMYLLEPVVGAVLALVVYCVLRGGLTTSMASSGDINPYGVTAVAALVGMFSRQTVDKLHAVFNTLLTPPRDSPEEGLTRTGGSTSDPGPDS